MHVSNLLALPFLCSYQAAAKAATGTVASWSKQAVLEVSLFPMQVRSSHVHRPPVLHPFRHCPPPTLRHPPHSTQAAQRGLTAATARYGVLQGAMAFLGPVMWGSLALDLALKAIGTDYARVVRAVYILAQASGRTRMCLCVALWDNAPKDAAMCALI